MNRIEIILVFIMMNIIILNFLSFFFDRKMREWMYVRLVDGYLNDQFVAGVEQFGRVL